MKRLLSVVIMLLLVAILSGCILSKTPSTNSVTMTVDGQMTFSVNVFPPGGTYTWTLDGVTLSNTGKSYIYPADGVGHSLTVKATHILGTDSQTWNIIPFIKFYGGSAADGAHAVQQTTDGGYILAGFTYSYGAGDGDVWLIKTDVDGNMVWDKTFGGSNSDIAYSVQQTSDGGYILAGFTDSYGAGGSDAWLIKTDTYGNKVWDKTFGGINSDQASAVQQTSDGGYILAGYTGSYGAGGDDAWLIKTDVDGNKVWDKTFGGSNYDQATLGVQQTTDGGYILAGCTQSYEAGNNDAWLVKTDADGNKIWDKTFGGSGSDVASSVQQTSDGGYMIFGFTDSFVVGDWDIAAWLIKIDANGNKVWDKTLGENGNYYTLAGKQTSDGGYILAGFFIAGDGDAWLIKTDANGNKVWEKTFGGKVSEAWSVQQTTDGGYILAGCTLSFVASKSDVWLIKTDANGNYFPPVANAGADQSVIVGTTVTLDGSGSTDPDNNIISYIWQQTDGPTVSLTNSNASIAQFTSAVAVGSVLTFELTVTDASGLTSTDICVIVVGIMFNKTFGGSDGDEARAVQQTSDGGYILAGYTGSYGAGGSDAWLIKTDTYGNKVWDKTFGGSNSDIAYSVQQTSDGGYILAGFTDSYGAGGSDAWLIKTDTYGNKVWDKTFGRSFDTNIAYSVQQTTDGGYILAGQTKNENANYDAWLIKTDTNGNKAWDKTFGGINNDQAYAVQQTSDGGFILTGWTGSYGAGGDDAWLIKTDVDGNMVWDKTFGGSNSDNARDVQQTSDGGYILAGYININGPGSSGTWLIKTDADGNMVWDKTFENWKFAWAVQQTSDGGYILAGLAVGDAWLIKTDVNGNMVWDKTFGGSNSDIAYSVQQTSDGGYILAGNTDPFRTYNYDAWLIKTDADGNAPATPTP